MPPVRQARSVPEVLAMTARRDWPSLFTRYHNKTLTEIAQATGVSKAAVCQAAKRYGRTYKKGPYKRPTHDWEQVFHQYGHMPVREIAAITGVTRNHIYQMRELYQ
jgi:hypothetical protein